MTPEQYQKASFLERAWDYLQSVYAYTGLEEPPPAAPPGTPQTIPELMVPGEWTPEKAIESGQQKSIEQWQKFFQEQEARNKSWSLANWIVIVLLGLGAVALVSRLATRR